MTSFRTTSSFRKLIWWKSISSESGLLGMIPHYLTCNTQRIWGSANTSRRENFWESKGKYCFHISYYYTVDLFTSKQQESQRCKWLENVIDHFLEQNPGVWLLKLTYWFMGAFTRWKSILLYLLCFLHFFTLNICY